MLLGIITLSRTTGGLFISILGPTLLTLANNVGSSVGEVSFVFSGRSFGGLAGGMVTGYIMRHVNNMLSFGLAHFLLAAVMLLTPLVSDLWVLITFTMVGAVGFGFLDAGMQALILQTWGAKSSQGLIAYYHFTFVIGAFFAPLLAEHYLVDEDNQSICPNNRTNIQPLNITKPMVTQPFLNQTDKVRITTSTPNDNNPIMWAYLIISVFMFVVGVLFLVLGCFGIESRVRSSKTEVVETRKEDKLKDVALLFFLVTSYYFFCVAGESIYNSYIYSATVCSELKFSVTAATGMNTMFWVGFAAGRFCGVVIANYFTPFQIITADLFGVTISMVAVCLFGESVAAITWVVTFLYSFFQGTLYPCGVSWTSQFTNMSGNYIFIFTIGQTVGNIILLPIAGQMFDAHPFSVLNLVLICSVANALSFMGMVAERKYSAK
ncbi:sodium-dependent glucose transporter 1-like [Ciona intestinalis]